MPSEYAQALGHRLRAVRRQQGLSLQAVSERSEGRHKAVVVGSYERGDRAVTVQRLAELAELYGVPVASLLPDLGSASVWDDDTGLTLDVPALLGRGDPQSAPLRRYVETLLAVRGVRGVRDGRDAPGQPLLTLRAEDVRVLAAVHGLPEAVMTARLREELSR